MSKIHQKKEIIQNEKSKSLTIDFGNFEKQVNIAYLEYTFKEKVQIVTCTITDDRILILLGLPGSDRLMSYESNTYSIGINYKGKFSDYKKIYLKQLKQKLKYS